MLARLRKIEDLTIKITEEMPISYNIETDYLFQKGIEKGMSQKELEKSYAFVVNLLTETDFTDAKIASLVGVTVDFVEKIKIELAQKKK